MLDPSAEFRPGQLEAIEAVAEDPRPPPPRSTHGWGKSAVYFIATRLLRDAGAGPTLLVSPLLALMRNQMQMAERLGVRAETINSTNPDQFEPILDRLRRDEIDLLLVSPERFANERFTEEMLPLVSGRVGLLVIDEAHCISAASPTTSERSTSSRRSAWPTTSERSTSWPRSAFRSGLHPGRRELSGSQRHRRPCRPRPLRDCPPRPPPTSWAVSVVRTFFPIRLPALAISFVFCILSSRPRSSRDAVPTCRAVQPASSSGASRDRCE